MRIPLPSVPQQPTSTGRYSAPAVVPMQDATGAQMAREGSSVFQLGMQTARIADWEQDQVDDAKVTEADNLVSDAIRQAWADPENGYRAATGVNALGERRKKFNEDLDKRVSEIADTLDNDVQRDQWRRMANDRLAKVSMAADAHESDQRRNWLIGTTEARLKAARIDGNKDLMLLAVDDLARIHGEDEKQRDMRRLDATTQFHDERIRILAPDDPAGAAKMLADAKAAKEIAPAKLDDLQRLVQGTDADEKSLDLFSTIVNDPTRQDMPLSEQERIARAILTFQRDDKQLTAAVYDKTLSRINHHFGQMHELRNQQRRETSDQVEKVFVQDPAASYDTLPQPMREQIERLGMVGDVDRIEAQTRARRIAESNREMKDVELAMDVKRVEVLDQLIKDLGEALPPEGADPAAAAEFERQRKEKEVAAKAMRAALNERRASRLGVELPAAPQPPKKKSQEDEIRDALKGAREVFGR